MSKKITRKQIKEQLVKIYEALADIRTYLDIKRKGFSVHSVKTGQPKALQVIE